MEEDFSVGYWIRHRRKALDMTQKELADRVGCALITIAKIEADQRRPSREMAALLAEHLNIPQEGRATFVEVMRGRKHTQSLRRIGVAEFQPVEKTTRPALVSPTQADKLRGVELIGKISRSKLVGRVAELTTARNLWKLANAGECHALVIQGEPGIGKTRLARELIHEIKSGGWTVVVGECFSEGGMPYAPIVRILQSEIVLPPALPATALADLKTIAPQLEVYLPDIQANPPLDPGAEKARLFESIHAYFRHFYEKGTLLIVIEDAHWADPGSLAVLQSLMHRFRQENAPVLVMLTVREISPPSSPALTSFFDGLLRGRFSTTIPLERFDQNETRELLSTIFAQEITAEFIQLIHNETQGNPFFIEEVCKDLIESKQVYWDQDHWERKDLTELRVPQNVRTAIQARLHHLGSQVSELLQTAALIGRRFEFDVLRAIRAEEEEALIRGLEAACGAHILHETGQAANGGAFEFSHGLIASVLREGTSAPRRRNIHKRIVMALEKIHPGDFSLLAYHCREAEETRVAVDYFRKAGEHAMRAYALEDAIRYYSEALALVSPEAVEVCHLLLARARVYDLRGQRALQLADLQAAESESETLQDPSTSAAVALARGEYAIQVTEQAEAIEYARRVIDLSGATGLAMLAAQAYMLWGRALSETGELAESRARLLEAYRIAGEAGLGLIQARSMINLGNVDYRLGEYAAAREKYSRSLETIRALGERRIECMVINNLGNIDWAEGDLEAALCSYRQSFEIARSLGDRLNQARALSNLGSILTEQHRYSQALQSLEEALPLLRDLGQQADESILLGHLGDIMEALGAYDQAYQHKLEGLALLQKTDDHQGEAEALVGLSHTEVFRGKPESAEQFAQQALAISQQHGFRVEEAAAWQALAASKEASGKLDECESAYMQSLAIYELLNQATKCAELRAELARLAHERNDQELAQKHLAILIPDRNPETLNRITLPSVCWCCYRVLTDSESDIAFSLLENGFRTIQEVSQQISDPKAREHYLKRLPHHAGLVEAWESRKNRSPLRNHTSLQQKLEAGDF